MCNSDRAPCIICTYRENIVELGTGQRGITNMTYRARRVFLSEALLFYSIVKQSHALCGFDPSAFAPCNAGALLSPVLEGV